LRLGRATRTCRSEASRCPSAGPTRTCSREAKGRLFGRCLRNASLTRSCTEVSDHIVHVVPDPVRPPVEEDLRFEDFFEREKVRLFRALCLMTRDRALAEELTQDAFVNVLERWDQVGRLEDPTGYLYRTATNAFRNWHRRALLGAKRTLRLEPG